MKKLATLSITIFLFASLSAQDMGFKTTDIGAEYQWYPEGNIYNLHLAFNAKLNHSFQVRLGYLNAKRNFDGRHESGKGWGAGVGYRYYFKPFPYQLFVGIRSDIWSINSVWDYFPADFDGSAKLLVIHPAAETGYTFIINDQAYITPYVTAGIQSIINHHGSSILFKKEFVSVVGISAGFRL